MAGNDAAVKTKVIIVGLLCLLIGWNGARMWDAREMAIIKAMLNAVKGKVCVFSMRRDGRITEGLSEDARYLITFNDVEECWQYKNMPRK